MLRTPSSSPVSVPILARSRWVTTDLQLLRGTSYSFEAIGTWTDWTITCDANGYESNGRVLLRMTEWLRRAPRQRWFALIGTIDRNMRTQFLIGTSATVVSPATGILTCFANDVAFAYWNNRGQVELRVQTID